MGTKERPGSIDCYTAAAPDEPLFVLRANDISAPTTVRIWAEMYRQRKMEKEEWNNGAIAKYCEALDVSNEMSAWRLSQSRRADTQRVSAAADEDTVFPKEWRPVYSGVMTEGASDAELTGESPPPIDGDFHEVINCGALKDGNEHE